MLGEKELHALVTKVAKNELREDESTRKHALEQFRDWIEKTSDIRDCRTDDIFLLRFLRKRKFSVPMAEEMFLKYANFCQNYSHIMKNNDFRNPAVNLYMRNGFTYVSPFRTKEGLVVTFTNYGRFDPYNCSYVDHTSAIIATNMTVMEDDATQVLGVMCVVDLAGVTAAHATHAPLPEMLACMKAVQHTLPLRYKGLHYINMSPVVKWVLDLIVSNMSTKMTKRFFFHSKIEDLYKHLDRKVLPKEYGGDMPEAGMIDLWLKNLESKRDMVVLSDQLRLVHQQELKTTLPGSFRKLDFD